MKKNKVPRVKKCHHFSSHMFCFSYIFLNKTNKKEIGRKKNLICHPLSLKIISPIHVNDFRACHVPLILNISI